jgi:NAD(P)-dependent dehydrogenase (short-subunit alcohol dehydrogenase family)
VRVWNKSGSRLREKAAFWACAKRTSRCIVRIEARLYELEDWYRVLDVNLRGVVHGVQAAYPIMLRQGFGHIVNTASVAGLFPYPLLVGYTATKHSVVGLTISLRIEAAAGVRVSVLRPALVWTPALTDGGKYGKMLQPIPPEVLKAVNERQRPIRAEQLAEQALRSVSSKLVA